MSGFSIPAVIVLMAAQAILAVPAVAQDPPPEAKTPPCSTGEYRQFDFWIGEWKVTTPEGKEAGVNRIEKILNGCALQENWTGSGGTRGHSFNIYAASKGTWHQTWVDSNGMLLQLDGGLEGESMVLSGTKIGREGEEVLHRITWTPDDQVRVRQHWQMSPDSGESWQDLFDGLYTRMD